MGYEIEISYDLKKQKNVTNLLGNLVSCAESNECSNYFQYSECEGSIKKMKKRCIFVFYFDDEKFVNMSEFLKVVVNKYKKRLYVDSIYEIENNNLIYASPYYMKLMEKDQQDNYKERRKTRSYSDTDYYILREILKKEKW
tara:strand:+ start:242 stop:664 length:423 start_codon:yes stop_codon:yes gene_type:complete